MTPTYATYRHLADMPGTGALCDFDLPRRWRGLRRCTVHGFHNYVIYYFAFSDGIEVVRLLHGAQDRQTILRRTK